LEDPEYWTQCAKRIERAVNLAALLGRRQEHFDKVISHVESVLDAFNDMQKVVNACVQASAEVEAQQKVEGRRR
jgi:hypothetical protein